LISLFTFKFNVIGIQTNSNSAWIVAELPLNNNHSLTHTQSHRLVVLQMTTSMPWRIHILYIKLTIKNERYLHQPNYMWGHLHDFIISLEDFGAIKLVKHRQLRYMCQARKVSGYLYGCKCYRFCRFLQFSYYILELLRRCCFSLHYLFCVDQILF
jgi:hypothetical protein